MYKDIFTTINNESCFIREPHRKNNYGVIILGGSSCFVNETTSDFHESTVRSKFIDELARRGYTIGYSNAHNKNWGSPVALRDIQLLHRTMVDECYINPNIHIIATSMGAVLALKLLSASKIAIRSLMLLKPVMDLYAHRNYVLSRERVDRIVNEVSDAYSLKTEDVLPELMKQPLAFNETTAKEVAVKIVYGKRDDTVPFENNLKVVNHMSKLGFNIDISSLNNASHKDDQLFFDLNIYIDFLSNSERRRR